ncbi:hypothetical protein [Nonomuraea wenchangensis]|uniref:Uncharacterized protein n=1 Tax=Nonomuraea wenchangensis TaxID=568860 RepID=A0A1I0LVC9_9ACTN|nr:hypothetical protein [Nonomuraea wenchangensis]SEU46506.1 hypothetical protein SAMN05421811_12758 [Nonomuraea wenchangensis]
MKNCTCVYDCSADPRTACGLSGTYHLHSDMGACPVHSTVVVWNG